MCLEVAGTSGGGTEGCRQLPTPNPVVGPATGCTGDLGVSKGPRDLGVGKELQGILENLQSAGCLGVCSPQAPKVKLGLVWVSRAFSVEAHLTCPLDTQAFIVQKFDSGIDLGL
jgi:hypothetical protein